MAAVDRIRFWQLLGFLIRIDMARCGKNFWAYVSSWKIPEGNTSAISAWPGCLENNRRTQWDDDGIHGTLLSFVRKYTDNLTHPIKSCCTTLISLITCQRFGVNLIIITTNTLLSFLCQEKILFFCIIWQHTCRRLRCTWSVSRMADWPK